MHTPMPDNEAQRLDALRRYLILDTAPEKEFDELTVLAAHVCGTPTALVSLVDVDRLWFKARVGVEAAQMPRSLAFCAHAICGADLMLVPDATRDDRFARTPLVTADPRIRFYAGAPLLTPDKHAVGTLCVLDRVPRQLSASQVDALCMLSRQVVSQMELRRARVELQDSLRAAQSRERELSAERMHVEDSLRAAHQFTEAIIDGAAEGIVAYDRDLRYVRWNPFMEELTGMRSDEVLGQVAPELFPFLRESGIEKLLRRALEGETIVLPDVLVKMPRTGREVWESNRYAPQRDVEGNIVGVIALIRDITERKRAEERLRAVVEGTAALTGSEFFRSLVRHLAAASRARYAFLASCDAAGRRARVLSFWHGERFVDDQLEYDVANTPCRDVLQGRICHYSENVQTLFPKDAGLVRWQAQSYVGVPMSNAEGAIIGHLAVLDVAPMPDPSRALDVLKIFAARAGAELERLKAEGGLRDALAEVEELKNRLHEENVYLRRELIANVSHDLRSPLASIRGYLETLLLKGEALAPDKRRTYLEIAARQSERLGTLISELFELAKLDYKGYQINPEPVQLGELAQDVLQKFQLAAEEKGIALRIDVDADAGFVRADIGLIERALQNLLENALKHTHNGGSVSVAVRRQDSRVMVQVRDTGSGIPRDALPHIFERFYRVDRSRMLDAGGAGLGLAIVKRILDLHGSTIGVESALAEGSVFSFALPALPGAGAAAALN